MRFDPPARLMRALGERHGDGAADWLAQLPALAEQAVAHWELDVERLPAPGGRHSLVVLVRRPDGSPAALKLTPPFTASAQERPALAHWKGWGSVEALDAADNALLLERLHPETSLRSLPEAKALLEAAGVVRRLWVEPPLGHDFESVRERSTRSAATLRANTDPALAPLVSAALAAHDELCAGAPPERLLLHGAFRQGKVLAAERTPWLAVGPAPLVGERAYDAARLTMDRAEDLVAAPSGASSARHRVNRLADALDLDRERLRGWTLFRAVEAGARALSADRPNDAEPLLEFAGWL